MGRWSRIPRLRNRRRLLSELPDTASDRSFLIGTIAILGTVAAVFVWSTLDRPEPPSYAPTAAAPVDVDDTLVGPVLHTVDARDSEAWRFFDFSRGSVVDDPGPLEWDLAFQRSRIVANGGEGFAGRGAIVDLGTVPFDSVRAAPAEGWRETTRDTVNAAIENWYDYSMMSHLLTPRPRVYAVRTADGKYAKVQLVAYYCPEAVAACLTFRYVYQGAGTPTF